MDGFIDSRIDAATRQSLVASCAVAGASGCRVVRSLLLMLLGESSAPAQGSDGMLMPCCSASDAPQGVVFEIVEGDEAALEDLLPSGALSRSNAFEPASRRLNSPWCRTGARNSRCRQPVPGRIRADSPAGAIAGRRGCAGARLCDPRGLVRGQRRRLPGVRRRGANRAGSDSALPRYGL